MRESASLSRSIVQVTAQAPGKLILLGEYAVLEGAPALVASVNRTARVVMRDNPDGFSVNAPALGIEDLHFKMDETGTIHYSQVDDRQLHHLRFFTAALNRCRLFLHVGGGKMKPAVFTLDTDAFFDPQSGEKMGFGSSAALTVAVLAVGTGSSDRDALYRAGMDAHYNAQGKAGSGIDIAAAVWGGLLHYRIPNKPLSAADALIAQTLTLPEDLHMMVIWTGKPACTRRLLAGVRELGLRDGHRLKKMMSEMGRIAENGIEAVAQGRTPAFMASVKQYGAAMRELGDLSDTPIYSPCHRELEALVSGLGGVYKPSGAGGGDTGIAFAADEKTLQNLHAAVIGAGYTVPSIKWADVGGTYCRHSLDGAKLL